MSTYLRVITDYYSFRGMFVMGGDETTTMTSIPLSGSHHPVSGFGKTNDLWKMGNSAGWGGVWQIVSEVPDTPDKSMAVGLDPEESGFALNACL